MKKTTYILKSNGSGLYLIAVGSTGFKHGLPNKATRFPTQQSVETFKADCGITWATSTVPVQVEVAGRVCDCCGDEFETDDTNILYTCLHCRAEQAEREGAVTYEG